MAFTTRSFSLPDLMRGCSLKDATNPNYKEAAAESRAWINGYNVFTDRKRAFFVQGSNELLCSHVYSYAGYEQFRTCCDFVNLLFVVDEVSDDQNGKDARTTGQTFVKAIQDPNWDDGSKLSKITKDFRARLMLSAGPNNMQRFSRLCEEYADCIAKEAELREQRKVLGLEDYIKLRRSNSAVLLCFSLVEYILGIDLPAKTYEDPVFMSAYWAACDYVCWANDIYSYDMEQAKGHTGNNVVTVLMEERGFTLQQASDYIGERCQSFMNCYIDSKDLLSSSSPLTADSDALRFIEALGSWMVGNLAWSFESQRYFGAAHLQVKNTLVVNLRPCEIPAATYPESDDE